jgi:hypothetical protein
MKYNEKEDPTEHTENTEKRYKDKKKLLCLSVCSDEVGS